MYITLHVYRVLTVEHVQDSTQRKHGIDRSCFSPTEPLVPESRGTGLTIAHPLLEARFPKCFLKNVQSFCFKDGGILIKALTVSGFYPACGTNIIIQYSSVRTSSSHTCQAQTSLYNWSSKYLYLVVLTVFFVETSPVAQEIWKYKLSRLASYLYNYKFIYYS